jgi:phosphoribosyl-AMP cyclohydrolase
VTASGTDTHTVCVPRDWLDEVRFDDRGLVTAVAQDADSGRVLMVAWMNRESLQLTREEGRAIYWSRSRGRLWRKGEESGNVQKLREIRIDCDGHTVLLMVEQVGGIACHTGREHCFFRRLTGAGVWEVTEPVLSAPEALYGVPEAGKPGDIP